MIKKAGPSDSGNYTCKPSIAREASIKVHVLESKFESKDQLIYGGHRGSYTRGLRGVWGPYGGHRGSFI